jgi:hypothetical protein
VALAGWCRQCSAFVWVNPDGSCPKGHAPADVSNTYETDPAPQAPVTAAAPADAAPADAERAPSIQPEPDPDPDADPAADAESVDLPEADTVRLKAADLAAAVARSGIAPGPLAPSFGAQPSPDAAERLATFSGRSVQILDGAVAALADPPRAAVAQFSVADEAVTRLVMAWGATMEQVAVVARQGWDAAVSLRSPDEVFALLAGVVGLDGGLEPFDVRVELSPTQAIAWVALADTLRRARLHSMLLHGAPSDTCTVADVMGTLAAADAEDFRWALNMLDKVMPERASALADAASVSAALEGLIAAGVLNSTPADEGDVALYGLADVGTAAFDAWSHELSRLAVTVHGMVEGGGTTAETVLMVRDARRLWLVAIGPERGALACPGMGAATQVLRTVAGAAIPAPAGTTAAAAG